MGCAGRKLWYTDKLPFTSYTTFTPHSCVRRDFHAYVTSCIEYTTYKITVTCIECANVRASDQKKLKGSRSWKLDHCMSAESTVKRLKERIKQVMNNHSIEIDKEQLLHNLSQVMEEWSRKRAIIMLLSLNFLMGHFSSYSQQLQAVHVRTDKWQVHWHPLIIKWCLHLKMLSPAAYHALRTSGFLALPSERTVRAYTSVCPHCERCSWHSVWC